MPMYMYYDGIDPDDARAPGGGSAGNAGGFATGETQVHIEAPRGDANRGDLIFGGDDGAAHSNVEVLLKALDGPSMNTQDETPVHGEPASWLMA
jgi:hypothetical protein